MDEVLGNKHARWAVPVIAAILLFGCSCIAWLVISNILVVGTLGYTPLGVEEGWQAGLEAGQQSPVISFISLLLMCLTCVLPLVGGIGSFLYIDSYQKRKQPPGNIPGQAV